MISFVRFGRKKVVVIGLVVAAIANLLVTVIPDDRENTGELAFLHQIFSCHSFHRLRAASIFSYRE